MRNLFFVLIILLTGCDSTYHYIVFPPERIDYVLIPDSGLVKKNLDTTEYIISADKKSISFDKKDFKIEIKYMSDYQLNKFEFPEQSINGIYSTNPFTYGNWIDPTLGYTPNRFTVFKVTIYNYSASKINFNPENAFLDTERGDKFYCYGREEKTSKYQSLEAYFKKKKGSSGVDDDVYESRMGIIRRTVHTLGKPIFRSDVKDGLIVFEPLPDDAGKIKLTIKDFILGYDENNEASEFTTLSFYFNRIPLQISSSQKADSLQKSNIKILSPDAKPTGEAVIAVRTTNVGQVSQLMRPLEEYFSEFTNFKIKFSKTHLTSQELQTSNVLFILTGDEEMNFLQEHETAAANFIRNGGFIIADVFATNPVNKNWGNVNNFFTSIGALLNGKFYISRIPSDHILYSVWKRFDALPPVDIELYNLQQKNDIDSKDRMYDFLLGLYYENKLVGVLSNRGYAISWGEFYPLEFRIGKDYTKQREFLSNIMYYGLQNQKK